MDNHKAIMTSDASRDIVTEGNINNKLNYMTAECLYALITVIGFRSLLLADQRPSRHLCTLAYLRSSLDHCVDR
ncbi:hypothetical protein ACJMK2_032580 [Sinanodonta woodiana]|uniref:Uncharacterized protein n=1 Tax=Sinanodonta woodiana TaxID=1069815 RepID=A0ABD3X2Q8_SINWO